MKKDYSILMITLCIIFCVGTIGIDIIYWKHFPALYLAGIVAGGIALVISVVCLFLRLKKRDGDEKYYKILMYLSMISAIVAAAIPLIGTLITMFM
ncbi:MAG: hypothetical protein K2L88_02435 [Clostridiales bacterium]|nr:hypothetical protein [Clostridiales bacterium]